MPVTGLPAALEVMLSTLLDSESMSSFKVFGEKNATVVVLRFTSQLGQPSAEDRSTNCWRRKPPSQLRRDRRRRNKHQNTNFGNSGEQAPSSISPSVAGLDSAEPCLPVTLLPAMPTTQFATCCFDAREKPAETRASSASVVDTPGANSECTASTTVSEPTAGQSKCSVTVKQMVEELMRPFEEKWEREAEAERRRREGEAETDKSPQHKDSASDAVDNRVSSRPPVSSDAHRGAAASPPRPGVVEESTGTNLPSRRQQPRRSRKRRISAEPSGLGQFRQLGLFLYRTVQNERLWSFTVDLELKMLNFKDANQTIYCGTSHLFEPGGGSWGFDFMTLREVTDPKNGFVQDGRIYIQGSFKLDLSKGLDQPVSEESDDSAGEEDAD